MEFFGWLGGVCFALSAIPQAFKSFVDKRTVGMSDTFLSLWAVGEVSMLLYSLYRTDAALIFNYLGNGICLSVIIYYRIYPQQAKIIKLMDENQDLF